MQIVANLDVPGAEHLLVDRAGTTLLLSTARFGGTGAKVELHDLADTGKVTTVVVADERVDALAVTSDGATVIAAGSTAGNGDRAGGGTLSFIDRATASVTSSVPLGSPATAVGLSPDDRRIYLTDRAGSLQVLDRATGAHIATTGLGGQGADLAVSSDGRRVHVVGTTGLTTVDTTTNTVTATLGLRDDPAGIALTPDGRTAVVITTGNDNAVGVDLATGDIAWSAATGRRPDSVVVTPDGRQALVADDGSGSVTIIDLGTRTTTALPVDPSARDITLGPGGDFGFVAGDAAVVRFDRRGAPPTVVPAPASPPSTAPPPPSPGRTALVVAPVIDGWNTVRSVRRASLYDVPRTWTVDREESVTGYESPDGRPRVLGSGSARFGDGRCGAPSGSLATSVTRQTDNTDLVEAATVEAENWADAAYRDGADRPPTLRTGEPEATTTVGGRRAALVKVSAVGTGPVGGCGRTGAVYALAATGFTGELGPTVLVVVVADTDVDGAAPEPEIRRILHTLRPER